MTANGALLAPVQSANKSTTVTTLTQYGKASRQAASYNVRLMCVVAALSLPLVPGREAAEQVARLSYV